MFMPQFNAEELLLEHTRQNRHFTYEFPNFPGAMLKGSMKLTRKSTGTKLYTHCSFTHRPALASNLITGKSLGMTFHFLYGLMLL